MNAQTISKSFFVNFDAIIELCAGFDTYFEKHPQEKENFPQCNEPRGWHRSRSQVKSREMFIGKMTENFSKLLKVMSIELDAAFLEAEYYLTPSGEGETYRYANDGYSIAFDFYIDPTAQIECCAISLSFPKDKEDEIVSIIRELQNDSVYVVKGIYNGDFHHFYAQILNLDSINKRKSNIFKRIHRYLKKY